MSAFDRVIGELRGEARLDGHGEITLDGRQARAKLRAYQLADPRAYVLLLVQSAALRGASRIDLEISSKTATIAFDGHPVSAADLEGLYTSIFERPRDRLHRARQSLDLALNGALSLAPRRLEIVAGDGGGLGVWAELEDDGRDRIERRHVVGGGTQITVHERLGVHLIDRAMVYNGIAELLHLRRAARLAPLDVRVNGEALSRRRVEPGELLAAGVALSLGETRLLAGFAHDRDFVHDHFVPPAEQAAVDLLVGGIWLGRIGLEGVTPHLRVVVDDPRLRTDLSLTRVVEDELYWTVVAKAWRAAAGAFVRLLGWPEEWRPAWAEAALRGFLLRWPGDLVRDLQRDPELALLLPILRWPRVGGGWRSAAAILAEGGPVPFVRRPIPAHAAVAGLAAAIVCEDVESVALLRRIAGGREDPVDFAAELAEHRAHNLRLWRQRPHVTRSGDELLAWEAIVGPGIGGEVGIRRRGGPTEIDVVVDDHVIATLRAALPLGGVRAAITGAFEARPSFDGVYADRRFAAAIVGLLRALDRMVRFLLDPASQSAWRTLEVLEHERVAYLELLVDAGARRLLLRSLGVDEATAAAVEAGEVGVLPGLDLDGPAPHPIAALPLFPEVGGGGRSLAELIARHRAGASIDHVSERAMTIDELDPGCLRLDRWRRGILAALLGPDALVERSGLPAWALDARRPPRRRALAWARAPLLEVSRAVDGVDVRAAIMAEGTGDVVVLKEGFEILRASLAVPGLAVIASDDLATIDGVDLSLLSSARTEALIDAVVGGLDLLVARAIAAAPGVHGP
ncbi:MAG: hypothetical protein H6710_16160 [Myxococcales bacterium]|nr:hypothetical protein [Myxococcales bacterium]